MVPHLWQLAAVALNISCLSMYPFFFSGELFSVQMQIFVAFFYVALEFVLLEVKQSGNKTAREENEFSSFGQNISYRQKQTTDRGYSKRGGIKALVKKRWCDPGHVTVKEGSEGVHLCYLSMQCVTSSAKNEVFAKLQKVSQTIHGDL